VCLIFPIAKEHEMVTFRAMLAAIARRLGFLPFVLGAAVVSSGSPITAYGVNDSGLIVGVYGATSQSAFVYNPATNAYTFFSYPGATNTAAVGINDSGQISGSYTTNSGNYGFLLSDGTYTTISVPRAVQSVQGGTTSYNLFDGGGTTVSGINDNGVIVGSWQSSLPPGSPGFVYSGGTFSSEDISYPSSAEFVDTGLYGINDSGTASGTAGYRSSGGVTQIGFLYNTGTNAFTPIIYPGATSTLVQGINDSGEVVGFYILAGQTSGFTYLNGVFTSVMYPGSNYTELFGIGKRWRDRWQLYLRVGAVFARSFLLRNADGSRIFLHDAAGSDPRARQRSSAWERACGDPGRGAEDGPKAGCTN
jgi:hypothetical protein